MRKNSGVQIILFRSNKNKNDTVERKMHLISNQPRASRSPDLELSDNNLASELEQNRSFFKPITRSEILIFVINYIIPNARDVLLTKFQLKPIKCTRTDINVAKWAHHSYFANMVTYHFYENVFGREPSGKVSRKILITLISEETPYVLVEKLSLGVATCLE